MVRNSGGFVYPLMRQTAS